MKRPTYALVALALTASMILAACGTPSTPTQTGPAPTTAAPAGPTATTARPAPQPTATSSGGTTGSGQQAVYGGTLKMIRTMEIINLGYIPDYASPDDINTSEPALQALLWMQPDGQPGPGLATEYKLDTAAKTITFTLRQGVKFHDGSDLNAQAVKYNLELYNKGTQTQLRPITSIDIIDDYHLRLNLSSLQLGFINNFGGRPGHIQSEVALKKESKEWFLINVIGTGPFKFTKYVRQVSATFVRNDAYWEPGKPYLDKIETAFVPDATTSLLAFKGEQSHTLLYPSYKDRGDLVAAGYKVLKGTGGPLFGIYVADSVDPASPWSDVRVRRALAHAIDREQMTKGLTFGWGQPTNQLAADWHWSYNKDIKGYPYDPQKAKQLLTEAGYPDGFKTTLYGSTAGTGGDRLEAVMGYMKAVGIQPTVEVTTMASGAEIRQKGWKNGVSVSIMGHPSTQDPAIVNQIWSSKSGSYPNIYHSKQMDDLLTQMIVELDTNKRKPLIDQFNKLMIDEHAVIIPLWFDPGTIALNSKVRDLRLSEQPYLRWTPEDAWLAK